MCAFSSLILMACSKGPTVEETYKVYNDLYIQIQTDNLSLSTTGYSLNNFVSRNQQGQSVQEAGELQDLLKAPLSFIGAYYSKLEGLKEVDLNKVMKEGQKLANAYKDLNENYNTLQEIKTKANYLVYNGYFAGYKSKAISFVSQAYQTANTLSSFITEKTKITRNFGTDKQTKDDVKLYTDCQQLKIFNDIKLYVIDGLKLKTEMYITFPFDSLFVDKEIKDVTLDQTEDIQVVFNYLAGEREKYQKSLEKVSLLKLLELSLEEREQYIKDNQAYINVIENYKKNILMKVRDFENTNIYQ